MRSSAPPCRWLSRRGRDPPRNERPSARPLVLLEVWGRLAYGARMPQRVALVTGAGGGIGRAVALELAAAGQAIAVADIREPDAAGTAAAVGEAGGNAVDVAMDVTDQSSVLAGAQRVEE